MKDKKHLKSVQVNLSTQQVMNILNLIYNYLDYLKSLENPNPGTKAKIQDLYEMASELHKAISLDPKS
jgi:hypothetical protein